MIRLNLVLLAALVLSAFFLVHLQYESRSLYAQLDRAQSQARDLEAEHEQLQAQKRSQATPSRVQQLAVQSLQMRPANPGITQYVELPAQPVAAGEGAVSGRVRSSVLGERP
ncbi:MAG: cell division protein FtsL [Serpentinimonas sp.]|jgi:cell division protein FtsL|nr:cell division protein FtsL [Serpentinimonas sp.]